jgi:hypothetical protein
MGIDDLRLAVKEVICDSGLERQNYEEALLAITVEEPLSRSVPSLSCVSLKSNCIHVFCKSLILIFLLSLDIAKG